MLGGLGGGVTKLLLQDRGLLMAFRTVCRHKAGHMGHMPYVPLVYTGIIYIYIYMSTDIHIM